jgi:ribonuclease HII
METLSLFESSSEPSVWLFEQQAMRQGYHAIAGIDEAGRGPLAGPVVAAAVILPYGAELVGVKDSKKLSAVRRAALFTLIHDRALAVGVGVADHLLIDRINILQATLVAMSRAVAALEPSPDYLLIDGITPVPVPIPQRVLKKGESASISIAAASIVAKVTRDRLMDDYDRLYPGYGFADHKGYGCAAHRAAIAVLGPCPIHRETFRGVREYVHP